MTASKTLRRARRKHAVASLLLPEDMGEAASQQRLKRILRKLFEATSEASALVHAEDFWEKVRRYTSKILEATRAPVCNMMQVPITFVDAAREIVRFLCQQITACARRSQTHLGGAACGEAAFFVKEALEDMEKSLAATLAWLTSERFWRELRAFLKEGEAVPVEVCQPLARTTFRQRAANVAKTVLALPPPKRQAYLGGLKALGRRSSTSRAAGRALRTSSRRCASKTPWTPSSCLRRSPRTRGSPRTSSSCSPRRSPRFGNTPRSFREPLVATPRIAPFEKWRA